MEDSAHGCTQGKSYIGTPPSNYARHCYGSRPPFKSSSLAAYTKVVDMGASLASDGGTRGIDVTGDGLYHRVDLSIEEAIDLFRLVHPKGNIVNVMKRFGAKIIRTHAYYTTPRDPPTPPHPPNSPGGTPSSPQKSQVVGNTLGWHSDPMSGALIQIHGSKQLMIGGTHIVPEGSNGVSLLIDSVTVGAGIRTVELQPNAIVGFGVRQVHNLSCLNSINLSLSLTIVPTDQE